MKRLFTFLLALLIIIVFANFAIAQSPCHWFSGSPVPDQATIDAGRIDVTVGKISSSNSPTIDGIIDNVWNSIDVVNIAKHNPYTTADYNPNPDPGIDGVAKFIYDDNWFYMLVVVSGDLEIDLNGSVPNQDNLELAFQNTWGGKGTAAEHCNDADYTNWYWEQDGDRKWAMPANKATTNLRWLDQDVDDICGGSDCNEIEGANWLTYLTLDFLNYNSYTSNDTIIYEMAFHLKNWMKYSYTDISELEGHNFGFDVSVRDVDGTSGLTDHINISDPGNNTWAWAPACGMYTFGTGIVGYSVTFTVDDGTTPISGAQVTLNSQVLTTNGSGQVIFTDVLPGTNIPYSISATGFTGSYGTLNVTDQDINETVHMTAIIPGTYVVTFTVDDGTTAISGAQVTFNSQVLTTNGLGQAFFANVSPGTNLPYSVNATGFTGSSGALNIVDQDIEEIVHLSTIIPGSFTVTFRIYEETIPISGAQVTFNSQSFLTDGSGQAVFANVSSGTNLPYSVSATGFVDAFGTLNITDQDLDKIVLMDTLVPGTFFVTFTINDGISPISNAQVTFNSQTQLTNGSGRTIFGNVAPGVNLPYSVSATGYAGSSGTLNVSDQDINETVRIDAIIPGTYVVTFTVQDRANPMADVFVEFNSRIVKTGADGIARFYNVSSGNNLEYSADLFGYITATGSINVENADINTVILMWSNAVEESAINQIKVYPNPVNEILTIESAFEINNILILSITGQKLIEIDKVHSEKHEIDLSNLQKGIYLLNIQINDKSELYNKVFKY